MNWKLFVESLSMEEINSLSNLLYDKKVEIAKLMMTPLNEKERILVDTGEWIKAVKLYRVRHDYCPLLIAKLAVDTYRKI